MAVTKKLNSKIRLGIKDTLSKKGRDQAFSVIRPNMRKMVEKYPDLQERLRTIKENALNNLPDLLTQAVNKLKDNGCQVFIAKNAEEASKHVLGLINKGIVVKSKSNVGREIDIVSVLNSGGIQVVETDLGDWINQLVGSQSSHPLAPAIHIPLAKVKQLFSELVGYELEEDVNHLVGVARSQLRSMIATAEFGITGANAIAADTGTIILMENEGNIRAVTSLPKVHIVITGINKVVPTFEDGVLVVQAASVYGVGQDFGTYMSAIAGPVNRMTGKGFGPEEVHVVLVDNGRTEAKRQGFQEAFYCINCGSCQNFCPVYETIGNSFGKKYFGGIGVVQTAFTQSLAEAEDAGLAACLGCGNCIVVCPNRIDTPSMINRLRYMVTSQKGLPPIKKYLLRRVLSQQKKLIKMSKLAGRMTGSVFKSLETRRGMKSRMAIDGIADRLLPIPAKKSFLEIAPEISVVETPRSRVAFYVGCLVNAAYTNVGMATLKLLKKYQVEVVTPLTQECCGIPMLASGEQQTARELAMKNIDLFMELKVDKVINVCATCGSTIKNEYPKLFKGQDNNYYEKANILAQKTIDISTFLVKDLQFTAENTNYLLDKVSKVTYHNPCHLRIGQGVVEEPQQLLSGIHGLEFVEMEGADRCCGFGGMVSLEHYILTKEIAINKADKIIDTGAEIICTSCPGCMATLGDGLYQRSSNITVKHLVELLVETTSK